MPNSSILHSDFISEKCHRLDQEVDFQVYEWVVSLQWTVSTVNMRTNGYVVEVVREKVQDGLTGEQRDLQYTQCKIVGNGSFGVVFQTKLSPSGEDAAIKRVLQDKRFKVRTPGKCRSMLTHSESRTSDHAHRQTSQYCRTEGILLFEWGAGMPMQRLELTDH